MALAFLPSALLSLVAAGIDDAALGRLRCTCRLLRLLRASRPHVQLTDSAHRSLCLSLESFLVPLAVTSVAVAVRFRTRKTPWFPIPEPRSQTIVSRLAALFPNFRELHVHGDERYLAVVAEAVVGEALAGQPLRSEPLRLFWHNDTLANVGAVDTLLSLGSVVGVAVVGLELRVGLIRNLDWLQSLSSLEELRLRGDVTHVLTAETLRALPALRELTVGASLGPALDALLCSLPCSLRRLRAGTDQGLGPESVKGLSRLTLLESLDLYARTSCARLQPAPSSLRSLTLRGPQALSLLADLVPVGDRRTSLLTSLCLETYFRDTTQLPALPALTSLTLLADGVARLDPRNVNSSPGLRSLDLRGLELDFKLVRLPRLISLRLWGRCLRGSRLGPLPLSLESLCLEKSGAEHVFAPLSRLRRLRSLRLRSCPLVRRAALGRLLETLPSLEYVEVADCAKLKLTRLEGLAKKFPALTL
jgi:hypothetical protein